MNSKRFLKYLLEIENLSVKNFTGQNSGPISYLKTVLESWISGQKSEHLPFPGFTILHGQIICYCWNFKIAN